MLHIPDQKVPLAVAESGVIYVGGTRVTLDCVVEMFEDNSSAEEIVEQYDALQLADVYAVIAYLLRNPDEVKAYRSPHSSVSDERRQVFDQKFPATLRSRLLNANRERKAGEG